MLFVVVGALMCLVIAAIVVVIAYEVIAGVRDIFKYGKTDRW